MMKYKGKRTDNGEYVYGQYFEENHLGLIRGVIVYYDRLEGFTTFVGVDADSVSLFFGKKDKNGKEIYTNDKVKYKGKVYEVRYFEEYGAFGLYDNYCKKQLKGLYLSDYHTRQMELL